MNCCMYVSIQDVIIIIPMFYIKTMACFIVLKLFKTANLDKYANPQKSNSFILYSLIIDKKCYLNWSKPDHGW